MGNLGVRGWGGLLENFVVERTTVGRVEFIASELAKQERNLRLFFNPLLRFSDADKRSPPFQVSGEVEVCLLLEPP